jgi:hypothetical protein
MAEQTPNLRRPAPADDSTRSVRPRTEPSTGGFFFGPQTTTSVLAFDFTVPASPSGFSFGGSPSIPGFAERNTANFWSVVETALKSDPNGLLPATFDTLKFGPGTWGTYKDLYLDPKCKELFVHFRKVDGSLIGIPIGKFVGWYLTISWNQDTNTRVRGMRLSSGSAILVHGGRLFTEADFAEIKEWLFKPVKISAMATVAFSSIQTLEEIKRRKEELIALFVQDLDAAIEKWEDSI